MARPLSSEKQQAALRQFSNILTFILFQDIEVLNLRAKIDGMTRDRDHLSKANDQIMNEVHCRVVLKTDQ